MKNPIPVESMKKTIAYLYLLTFCPPKRIAKFKKSTAAMLKNLAATAGMKEAAYLRKALPEACGRIVSW